MPKFCTRNLLFRYFWNAIWKQYCHIWNQHPRICLIAKFCERMSKFCLNFGLKLHYFGIFGLEFKGKCCHIWNQHPRICLIAKFYVETKMPKFCSRNALFLYFWEGIWKEYLKSAPSNLSNCKILRKKQKYLNLKPKMLIWVSLDCHVRTVLSYLKSAPSNLSNWKILRKKKSLIWAKNALFGYFWAKIWKVYCHTWNLDPRTCLIAKYYEIIKMPKFGTKECLICVFLG